MSDMIYRSDDMTCPCLVPQRCRDAGYGTGRTGRRWQVWHGMAGEPHKVCASQMERSLNSATARVCRGAVLLCLSPPRCVRLAASPPPSIHRRRQRRAQRRETESRQREEKTLDSEFSRKKEQQCECSGCRQRVVIWLSLFIRPLRAEHNQVQLVCSRNEHPTVAGSVHVAPPAKQGAAREGGTGHGARHQRCVYSAYSTRFGITQFDMSPGMYFVT